MAMALFDFAQHQNAAIRRQQAAVKFRGRRLGEDRRQAEGRGAYSG